MTQTRCNEQCKVQRNREVYDILLKMNRQEGVVLLEQAIEAVSQTNLPPAEKAKAYHMVCAYFQYLTSFSNYRRSEGPIVSANTNRVFLEHYLTELFPALDQELGADEAQTIRLMLLKNLYRCCRIIAECSVYRGAFKTRPDTFSTKTDGMVYTTGPFVTVKTYSTEVHREEHIKEIVLPAAVFLGFGEEGTKLFGKRGKQVLKEIHRMDPHYGDMGRVNISNINYLLEGYFSFPNEAKLNKAKSSKAFSVFIGAIFICYVAIMLLISTVASQSEGDALAFPIAFSIGGFFLILSLVTFLKANHTLKHPVRIDYSTLATNRGHCNI